MRSVNETCFLMTGSDGSTSSNTLDEDELLEFCSLSSSETAGLLKHCAVVVLFTSGSIGYICSTWPTKTALQFLKITFSVFVFVSRLVSAMTEVESSRVNMDDAVSRSLQD